MQDPRKPNPFTDEPAPIAEPLSEEQAYELLKQRNKRRLVGAGAITLLVCGLFAAIAGNNSANQAQQPTLTEASSPNLTTNTPIIAAENNQQMMIASQTTPILASNNDTASQLAMPTDVSDQNPTIATSNQHDLVTVPTTENIDMAPAAVQESHNRHLAEQANQGQRENARSQAQARLQRAQAEREAREQAIAERARKAQNADQLKRAAERERLAQQKALVERKREINSTQSNAKPISAPKATGSGNFAVQAGAFSSMAQADKIRAQIGLLGYRSTISSVKTANGTLYRVQATGFNSRNEAQNAANKMKSNGLGGMVIGK